MAGSDDAVRGVWRMIWDVDSRPLFVLDLDPDFVVHDKHAIRPIFCNAALRQHVQLLDNITGTTEDSVEPGSDATTYEQFRIWATGTSRFNNSKDVFPLTLQYRCLLWTGSTVRSRFRIISGNALFQASNIPRGDLLSAPRSHPKTGRADATSANPAAALASAAAIPTREILPSVRQPETPSVTLSRDTSKNTSGTSSSVTLSTPDNSVPDWTVPDPVGILSDHVAFARKVDWANTPLGPMEKWSLQFREVVNLLMRNPHPCALFWGEELTMIYNLAYKTEVAGNKHPDLMGTGFSGPFSELWDGVAPIFQECARTGHSVRKENDPLPIERYGYLEETFFSWSFVPIYGGTDRILGFYNAPFETTYQTVRSRRMQMLRYLGECLNATRSVKQFWKRVLDGMEHEPYDVPFALLYSIADADDADTASHSSDSTISLRSCILEGSIGIPKGHVAAPQKLDLKRSQEGFVPAFREAMRTREPTTLHTRDGTLPEALLQGIEWRGYGDPCKDAIIFPVRPTNGDNVCAFLLIGINPRRAYDDEYQSFAAMLARQLATSLASVLLFEDEVRRSRRAAEAAAQQREQLSQQLELQTSRMRRMTELSPLGMYLFNTNGVLIEANERYYEMTGHARESDDELSFLTHIDDNSKKVAQTMWDDMIKTLKPLTREIQLKNPQQRQHFNGEPIEYWVLASSSPEIGPDGEVISIMGSITDISHMKWAQGLQDRRLREAEETKRQQNEFIDITSHEMRNPLSAILICADDIRDTLTQHKFANDDQQVALECIEAANNIALCVQHQKSIVDDILTVSKLDSNLLLITPVPTQPVAVVQRGMAMFKPEVLAKGFDLNLVPHDSLQHYKIDWVLLDPSRLLQITVNLITNAIKFTANCPKRSISVHVSASPQQPDVSAKGFQFVPTRGAPINVAAGEDWGSGELLYLRIDVEDTGCGLTAEEKDLLFEKFAQASPRTHAHYGGSGLGLFISRQLAELHGGQIGVSSEAGRIPSQHTRPSISQNPSIHAHTPDHAEASRELVAAVSGTDRKRSQPEVVHRINMDQIHVLIVEDNIVNQKVLSKQLTKAGCIVSTADNGIYALNHLVQTDFHIINGIPLSIILMDLEMPEMDGLTCCKRIREMESKKELNGHVPIIAVTANVRGEQIATAKESGMDDVVSKPFRIPDLLAKIQALLHRLNGR
ncbi:putative histidine kinase HHK16p [Pyrenochaeta sp. MPI-SDFR-AT-0127]|nr:putative histidine kinase HHK16p [Pyrenochaeta sp. MPI-SDFR-AT-0127]